MTRPSLPPEASDGAPSEVAPAAKEGPPWPSDHPGRKCRLCALTLYPLWIDNTPPPGTCPHKAETPGACPHNVEISILGMTYALQTGDGVEAMRQVVRDRGLEPARIEAFARDWLAVQKEHFEFETAAIKVRGVELHHWLGQQPDKALQRAGQVMKAIAYHLQFGLDDLGEVEGDAWRERFKRAMRYATRDLLERDPIADGDYELDVGDAEGGR